MKNRILTLVSVSVGIEVCLFASIAFSQDAVVLPAGYYNESTLNPRTYQVYMVTTPEAIVGVMGVATLVKTNKNADFTLEVFTDKGLTNKVSIGEGGRERSDLVTFPGEASSLNYFIKVTNWSESPESYRLHSHNLEVFNILIEMGIDELVKGGFQEMGAPPEVASHLKTGLMSALKGESSNRMIAKMSVSQMRMMLKKELGLDDGSDYILKFLTKVIFGTFKNYEVD